MQTRNRVLYFRVIKDLARTRSFPLRYSLPEIARAGNMYLRMGAPSKSSSTVMWAQKSSRPIPKKGYLHCVALQMGGKIPQSTEARKFRHLMSTCILIQSSPAPIHLTAVARMRCSTYRLLSKKKSYVHKRVGYLPFVGSFFVPDCAIAGPGTHVGSTDTALEFDDSIDSLELGIIPRDRRWPLGWSNHGIIHARRIKLGLIFPSSLAYSRLNPTTVLCLALMLMSGRTAVCKHSQVCRSGRMDHLYSVCSKKKRPPQPLPWGVSHPPQFFGNPRSMITALPYDSSQGFGNRPVTSVSRNLQNKIGELLYRSVTDCEG